MKTILLDADPIRYRVGFAGQKTIYQIAAELEDGRWVELSFHPAEDKTAFKQLQEWKAANPTAEVFYESQDAIPDPVSHVLSMTYMQMESITNEICQHQRWDRRDVSVQVYLSGKGNYREAIATSKVYKGNRDPKHKPVHFKAIGDYLCSSYHAVVVDGREADDEVSIRAWRYWKDKNARSSYVVSTIDKDLDQIPGAHYDYMKKVHYHVSENEANDWFWRQIISGDGTDNIGGACGVGPKSADAFISEWAELSDAQRWEKVLELYADRQSRPKCYYKGKNPSDVALENARLVYLQRVPGELWVAPGMKQEVVGVQVDD